MNSAQRFRPRNLILGFALLATTSTLAIPRQVDAHGVWGHVHVTGWAIENLPPGELRDFFQEPEVFNAAIFGAAFTDSGYAVRTGPFQSRARAYSEHTHWEPFIEDFIEWIRENDPPPWDTPESRRRVAFLMGCAAHGLQDEVFDSLFLYQVDEHDHGGQDEADPGSDGFLALDGHIRLAPTPDIPMETLLELYSDLGEDITEGVIQLGVDLLMNIYLNDGPGISIAESLGEDYEEQIPWTRAHYLDPNIPGSLRAEINPTAAYLEALWARLNGEADGADLVIHAYPESPRRLLSHDSSSPDSWVTFIFAEGVSYDSATPHWFDDDGGDVPLTKRNTRWNAGWTRLVRLLPDDDLVPGDWYRAGLNEGATPISGATYDDEFSFRFQVNCEGDSDTCPPLDEIVDPSIDGPEEPPVTIDPDVVEPDPEPDAAPDVDMTADRVEQGEDMGDTHSPDDSTAAPADESGCSAGGRQAPPLAWILLLATLLLRRTLGRSQNSFV